MTDKLQSIDTISSIDKAKTEKNVDPLQAEYEEGKIFLGNQSYGQAAVALHNALVGFKEKNDEAGIANASNQLGHVCLAREEYDSALQHYQLAYEICDKSYDRMSVLTVLKKIVEARRALGQYDLAIKDCLEILESYQDNRDPQGTVETLEEMAEIYQRAGKKDKAADAYRTIASIHKNFKHDKMAAGFMEKADALVTQG